MESRQKPHQTAAEMILSLKNSLLTLASGGLLASSATAAVIINPVSVERSGGTVEGDGVSYGNFDHTIDGSGVADALLIGTGSPIPGTMPSHVVAGTTGNSVQTVSARFSNPAGAVVTYDLGAVYDVENLIFWNGTETWNSNYYNDRGVASATIAFSSDGINFANAATYSFDQVPDGTTPFEPEIEALNQSGVRYVQFSELSSFGGARTGWSEVRFSGIAVPEPSGILLGLAGLGLALRRRRD